MAEPSSSDGKRAAGAGLPPAGSEPAPEPVPLAYAPPYPAPPPEILQQPMNAYVASQLKAGADPADFGLRPPAQAATKQPSPGPSAAAPPTVGVESSRDLGRDPEPGPSGH